MSLPMPQGGPLIQFTTAPQGPREPPEHQHPPPRVRVALQVLEHFFVQQLPRAAVNDISIEWAPQKELTTAEANCRATAANVLSDYLNGKMPADRYERERSRVTKEEGDATIVKCPACFGQHSQCEVCGGVGRVKLIPCARG